MPRIRGVRAGGGTTAVPTHAASGRHRAGLDDAPAPKSSHSGRKRWSAGVAATAVVVGTIGAFAPSASAAISAAGPADAASLFPSYYQDASGLRLQLCQDGLPNCLAGPEQIQAVHARGGDAEAFYYHASVDDVGGFLVESALEAAYLADGPDQEVTFQRRQASNKTAVPNGTYKITDPFGSYTCTADATGLVQPAKGCRFETTPIPGNFNAALSGPIGPFVTWDTFGAATGAPPAGFIGDNTTPHKVVGSPTGFNKMRVEGPGITGTCTNADGGTVANCDETDLLIVQGKVQPGGAVGSLSAGALDFGDVAATPVTTKTLTYSNVGDAPITINSANVTGTGAAAFKVTNNCPVAPATLNVGLRCTIDVSFTPEAGKASTATLTITDDTAVATRDVALKGSNLGVMYVSDPVPPASLLFPTTGVGSTSLEDNVVIGNSGKGPLTISAVALTGASAGHYKLGPNNTCRTPVASKGGCEIGVQFAPTSSGSKSATLEVTDSTGKTVTVPLNGTGGTPAAPGAPTIGTASAGNASATVNWTAPTTGGAPASYTVQAFANGSATAAFTQTGVTTTSATFGGLTNGTSYRFSVVAVNGGGSSTPSALSTAVTPTAPDTTAPTVTARTPATSATNVAVTSNVTATFSEAVQGVSGTTVTLRAAGSTTDVPATVTYNTTTRVATLDPTVNLANSTTYTATLTGGPAAIRDASNNALVNPVSWTFTTAAADAVPTVTAQTPAANATNVGVTGNVTATFSEVVSGVSGTTFTLRAAGATTNVGATVTYNATTNVATLDPTASLAAGTQYTATLTGGATAIRDSANQALANTSWTFTTAAAIDPVPTVSGRSPAAGATGVAVANNITATFSEAVQGVSGTTFTLRAAGSTTNVPAAVSLTGNVATLDPTASLANSTQYTATLTGGTTAIRDSANQALANTSWTFTTAAGTTTDTTAPTVTARTPASGGTGASRTANITFTFGEAVQGVSTTTVVLKNDLTGGTWAGTVTRNGTTNQWIFDPTQTSLLANTRYRLSLTGGATAIRDNAGNPLVSTSWTFTTGA